MVPWTRQNHSGPAVAVYEVALCSLEWRADLGEASSHRWLRKDSFEPGWRQSNRESWWWWHEKLACSLTFFICWFWVVRKWGCPKSFKSVDHELVLKPMVTWGIPHFKRLPLYITQIYIYTHTRYTYIHIYIYTYIYIYVIYVIIYIHYIDWRQLDIFVGWWSQLTNCMNSCNVLWIGCTHLQYSDHKNDWTAISQYFCSMLMLFMCLFICPYGLAFEEPGKVINIFQTTSMGHKGHVNAKAVYASTGVPSPEEITHFLKTLLNGSVPWFCQTCLSRNVQK